jgi:hypothetical protein
MQHKIAAAVVVVVLFATSDASADGGWIARCEAPQGVGIKYGDMSSMDGSVMQSPDDGFEQFEDSFSNTRPVFMYPGSGADQLSFVWGSTKPDEVSPELFRKPKARHALIVSESEVRVTTLERYPVSVWVTSHFPRTWHRLRNKA